MAKEQIRCVNLFSSHCDVARNNCWANSMNSVASSICSKLQIISLVLYIQLISTQLVLISLFALIDMINRPPSQSVVCVCICTYVCINRIRFSRII